MTAAGVILVALGVGLAWAGGLAVVGRRAGAAARALEAQVRVELERWRKEHGS
jgi:hypothetical protein